MRKIVLFEATIDHQIKDPETEQSSATLYNLTVTALRTIFSPFRTNTLQRLRLHVHRVTALALDLTQPACSENSSVLCVQTDVKRWLRETRQWCDVCGFAIKSEFIELAIIY